MNRYHFLLAQLCLASFVYAAGFMDSASDAFALAKKQQKPIMIHFYGVWCPPCNEMKEMVYSHPDFIRSAEQMVLLQIDADQPRSAAIKDKYKVGGYPTILFLNPTGKEIYRVVGSRRLTEFLRIMRLVVSAKGQSIESACRRKDEDSLWQCAVVCDERGDVKCATEAFGRLKNILREGSARYQLAQGFAAAHAENPDMRVVTYQKLLKKDPHSALSLAWASSYWSELAKAPGQQANYETLRLVAAGWEKQKNDPRLDEVGLSDTDLLWLRGELLENLGEKGQAVEVFKECAARFAEKSKQLGEGAPARGFTMERIGCLRSAGEKEKALQLAQEYRAKFPEEMTFHHTTASILFDQKKYPEATQAAKQAFEKSYGDNRIRVATMLVKLYGTVPDKAAARALAEKIRVEHQVEKKLEVRTHKLLRALDEALAAL